MKDMFEKEITVGSFVVYPASKSIWDPKVGYSVNELVMRAGTVTKVMSDRIIIDVNGKKRRVERLDRIVIIEKPVKRRVFVFGSNLHGAHNGGASLEAKLKWGALEGRGSGLQGDSYAIPTIGFDYAPLALPAVSNYVDLFLDFARQHPDVEFVVTKIGCGAARNSEDKIMLLFQDVPQNCLLPKGWR